MDDAALDDRERAFREVDLDPDVPLQEPDGVRTCPAELLVPEGRAADGEPCALPEGDGQRLRRPERCPRPDACEDAPARIRPQGHGRSRRDPRREISISLDARRLRPIGSRGSHVLATGRCAESDRGQEHKA